MANDAEIAPGRWRMPLPLSFDDIADILGVVFKAKFMLIELSGSLIDYSLFPRVLPHFQNRFQFFGYFNHYILSTTTYLIVFFYEICDKNTGFF